MKTIIYASTRAVCALARLARGGSPTQGIELTTSARRFGLILIVTVFTGLYMNLPSVLEPALAAVAPFTERPATRHWCASWRQYALKGSPALVFSLLLR